MNSFDPTSLIGVTDEVFGGGMEVEGEEARAARSRSVVGLNVVGGEAGVGIGAEVRIMGEIEFSFINSASISGPSCIFFASSRSSIRQQRMMKR